MAQGSLVKKGDRYYGVFYVGPNQVWRALKTSVEREAHKRLREVMRSLDTGRYRETTPLTFAEFSERYLDEYAEETAHPRRAGPRFVSCAGNGTPSTFRAWVIACMLRPCA